MKKSKQYLWKVCLWQGNIVRLNVMTDIRQWNFLWPDLLHSRSTDAKHGEKHRQSDHGDNPVASVEAAQSV